MILRSAFTAPQTSMILFGEMTEVPMQEDSHGAVFSPQIPPSMLVRHDVATHKFLHHNYTMFRCLWGCEMNLKHKVETFRDVTHWMRSYNTSLIGRFADFDDYLAWSIVTYVEEEHHFD